MEFAAILTRSPGDGGRASAEECLISVITVVRSDLPAQHRTRAPVEMQEDALTPNSGRSNASHIRSAIDVDYPDGGKSPVNRHKRLDRLDRLDASVADFSYRRCSRTRDYVLN